MIGILFETMRVSQYKKQLIVFMPALALGNNIDFRDFGVLVITFIIFSLSASSVYLFNDICDYQEDRRDNLRKSRPIASNRFKKSHAKALIMFLLFFVFFLVFLSPISNKHYLLGFVLFYLFLNFLYSRFKLRRFRIPGIVIVAIGFPIRFSCGSIALGLPFSFWAFLLLTTLCVFLLSGKRLQLDRRSSSDSFTSVSVFWTSSMVISAASFMAAYAAFIGIPEIQERWGLANLILSCVPLLFGLLRYIELVLLYSQKLDQDVTDFFVRDSLLVFNVVLFSIILWIGRVHA